MRDRGHEVLVFAATAGPLADQRRDARASPSISLLLAAPPVADDHVDAHGAGPRERVDVLHPYEWPPCLECSPDRTCATASRRGDRHVHGGVADDPVVDPAGRRHRADRGVGARAEGARCTSSNPPTNTDANHRASPATTSGPRFALDPARPTIVVVSRLAAELKREGIERAIDAVEQLDSAGSGPQLLVVGDGPDRARIDDRARAVNGRLGGPRVVLAGELLDPRPAYALADVVLGMGGSALRAMAFAKPLVVLGERGFSEVLEPHTWEQFLWSGFFGIGDGDVGDRSPASPEPARRPEPRASSPFSLGWWRSGSACAGRPRCRRRLPPDARRAAPCAPGPALRGVARRGARAGVEGGPRLPVGAGGRRLQRSRGVGPHGGVAGAAPGPTATPDRS